MRNWRRLIAENIIPAIAGDHFWESRLCEIISDDISPFGLHLAIFVEPYLTYILEGRKTVESRFGVHRRAPYGQVAPEDVILLKRSGGPVTGICLVSDVWFYNVNVESWQDLRTEFAEALCAQDPEFWETRKNASFATLMRLSYVRSIDPVAVPKKDRRGWVVLRTALGNNGALLH